MKKGHREIIGFLRAAGAKSVRLDPNDPHPRIYFVWNGVEQFTVVACTPSDPYAVNAAIQRLRRDLGLIERNRPSRDRRRRRQHNDTRAATLPARLTAIPDWHPRLLDRLSAQDLGAVLYEAWNSYWRDCMASVGARSLL